MSSSAPTHTGDGPPRRISRLSGYAVVLLALALGGGLYTAFGAPKSSAANNPAGQQSLAVKEGRDLFLQGCSTCHGLNLQGGAGGPSLIGVGAAAVVFQVGSGRMPLAAVTKVEAERKQSRYSSAEVDQLAAYIQANGGGPTLPTGSLNDGDLQLGGDLFRTNCASCHNFAGAGGALTYGKYAPPLTPASPQVIYAAMLSGPEQMPRFSDNSLSPDEKKAITHFVTYITRAQDDPGGAGLGRYGPVPEGLVAFVVGIGLCVVLTLWIGNRA